MPFKDPEARRAYERSPERLRQQRFRRRDERHPGWRQTYLDFNGMCAECGEVECLEFHEPFGEIHGATEVPRFQCRVPLCFSCHAKEHERIGDCHFNERPWPSRLQEDVKWEIEQAGGLEGWIAKFGLEPSKNYIPLEMQEEAAVG